VLVLQRRRGIGTALLNLFLAQPSPVTKFLHVQPDNTLARDFYARAGFTAGPLLSGYYRGLADTAALRMNRTASA
jgi:ribosomal protein S18 acetylase RimI-like enzyme